MTSSGRSFCLTWRTLLCPRQQPFFSLAVINAFTAVYLFFGLNYIFQNLDPLQEFFVFDNIQQDDGASSVLCDDQRPACFTHLLNEGGCFGAELR